MSNGFPTAWIFRRYKEYVRNPYGVNLTTSFFYSNICSLKHSITKFVNFQIKHGTRSEWTQPIRGVQK